MLKNPERIFERYIYGKALSVKTFDTSCGEADKRFAFIIDTDLDEHMAFKFSNNSFTAPERITAWKRLADLYNKCGIYAPKILRDKYGCLWNEYCENNERFIAYAEEKKRYKTTDELGIASNDNRLYFEDMVKAAAKIAECSTQLPNWKSAWCLYDKFCDDDETDETYYWQEEFHKLVIKEMPDFRGQADCIRERFLSLYKSFESQYKALPQAFFQGDEGGLNAMLDDNRKFVGVLDFNLAGAETILNYFFREFCRIHIDRGDISKLDNMTFLQAKDNEMRLRIETVKKYYHFNEAEKSAFPMYYKIVYPLECDNCQTFEAVIRKKNAAETKLILDWIEYQQTRDDISL